MQKRLPRLFSIAILLFSLPESVFTQNFIFEHSDCKIKIEKQKEEYQYLEEDLKKLLADRDFKVSYLIKNKKLLPQDLYTILTITNPPKRLWRECIIKASIKRAKGRLISTTDYSLFEKEVKRSLPRITFKGSERCSRALKEAFIHIPYCKKVGHVRGASLK